MQVLPPLTNAYKRLLTLYNTLYFNNIMPNQKTMASRRSHAAYHKQANNFTRKKNKKSVPVFSNQHTSYM